MATASNPDQGMVIFNGRRYTVEDAKAAGIKVDRVTKKAATEAEAAGAAALADATAVNPAITTTPAEELPAEDLPETPDVEEDKKEAKQVEAPAENKAVAAPRASTRRRS